MDGNHHGRPLENDDNIPHLYNVRTRHDQADRPSPSDAYEPQTARLHGASRRHDPALHAGSQTSRARMQDSLMRSRRRREAALQSRLDIGDFHAYRYDESGNLIPVPAPEEQNSEAHLVEDLSRQFGYMGMSGQRRRARRQPSSSSEDEDDPSSSRAYERHVRAMYHQLEEARLHRPVPQVEAAYAAHAAAPEEEETAWDADPYAHYSQINVRPHILQQEGASTSNDQVIRAALRRNEENDRLALSAQCEDDALDTTKDARISPVLSSQNWLHLDSSSRQELIYLIYKRTGWAYERIVPRCVFSLTANKLSAIQSDNYKKVDAAIKKMYQIKISGQMNAPKWTQDLSSAEHRFVVIAIAEVLRKTRDEVRELLNNDYFTEDMARWFLTTSSQQEHFAMAVELGLLR
ncbi:hypothetical protein CBS101457_000297 [Exobasidium rhododendri]|nr:hypothetical protein CBS101457_000297 [Exobasidium rhododendri]